MTCSDYATGISEFFLIVSVKVNVNKRVLNISAGRKHWDELKKLLALGESSNIPSNSNGHDCFFQPNECKPFVS